MRALTIYQPWATLIMAGAKPYEFRGGSYLDARRYRNGPKPGERIVIHASARKMKRAEVQDVLLRLDKGSTGLIVALARPILEGALTSPGIFPLATALGTAVIGEPRNAAVLFRGSTNDSDRADHGLWAWPLTNVERFFPMIPARGFQGFWQWRESAP